MYFKYVFQLLVGYFNYFTTLLLITVSMLNETSTPSWL